MVSASEDCTPSIIYHCVLRGLERLLLSEQLSRVDGEALVKLSVDRVNMPSPHRAMAALGLMLTCMYTGKKDPVTYPACWLNHQHVLHEDWCFHYCCCDFLKTLQTQCDFRLAG